MEPQDEKPKTPNELPDIPDQDQTASHPWRSSQQDHPVAQAETSAPVSEPTPESEPESPSVSSEPHTQPTMQQSQSANVGKPRKSFGQKIKSMLRSRKFWFGLFGLIILVLVLVWFIEPSRWWLANLFGSRNTMSITTITPAVGDAKASQLRNVAVVVNGRTYKTDDHGAVQISNVPYGPVSVKAQKAGFQAIDYGVTLDFDPFFHLAGGKTSDDAARKITLSMQATGIPVSFKVTDYLSGKPITDGEFAVGDVVTRPDKNGLVSLKVPSTEAEKVTVSTHFGGSYNDQKFDLSLKSATPPEITVVPAGKHYFVSKRSGVQTVYGSNLDGSDVQPIVTGTGKETDATSFAVSPDGKYGVLSSSRDGALDAKKSMLQRVYVVDLSTKQITRVDEGTSVVYSDWSGGKLVYTTTGYDGSSNTFPTTLRSVDTATKRVYNFESAPSISVSTIANDKVVYLKYTDDQASTPVLRVAPMNATTSKTLGDQVNYDSYLQMDFNKVAFKTGQDQAWHEYNLSTDEVKSTTQPSSGSNTVQYLSTANDNGSKRLIIDRVDGKYTLFVKDMSTGAETKLYGAVGLGGPIRWIGDVVVFRVVSDQETADYAVSINGGEPKKIMDITATRSTQGSVIDRFQFF